MMDATVERLSGARLLVVDDEERLRQTFARALTGRGYIVTEAASHADAMRVLGGGTFDLLLLDINLPDATGWDVLRDLRTAGRSLPTIVFSAVPPRTTLIREFRPDGVLHKPFPMDALFRLVERTLTAGARTDSLPDPPGASADARPGSPPHP